MSRELGAHEDSHADTYRLALDALYGVLGSYCRPLSFEILYSYWNGEYFFPVTFNDVKPPAEMLATSPSLPGLAQYPVHADRPMYVEGELCRSTVDDYINSSELNCGYVEGHSIGWLSMEVRSSMALIAGMGAGVSKIVVDRNGEKIFQSVVSVGEQLWGYGPQDGFLSPPMGVRISRDEGCLSLELALFWSIWIDGGVGEPYICEGVSGLERNGWIRSE
ncbi:hypothetical protein [Nocardia fluminea]|uniref:hypothetical protein n=1 Tax=Nocardia fluminea TaxID=134984 RepID=UPI00341AD299